jgi:hypothetical protein
LHFSVSNPVRHEARFSFALREVSSVRITVIDVGGRRVHRMAEITMGPGEHSIPWNVDAPGSGEEIPSGVYFARLESSGHAIVRRFVVAR